MYVAGDILAVELPTGDIAFARILYVSTYFRDLIGVVFSRSKDDVSCIDEEAAIAGPFYTNWHAANDEGWLVVGNAPLSDVEIKLTTRVVGGGVWIADEYIRPAKRDEMASLPRMQVEGVSNICTAVSYSLYNGDP